MSCIANDFLVVQLCIVSEFQACLSSITCLIIVYFGPVYRLFRVCLSSISCLFIVYFVPVYRLFRVCLSSISCLFIVYFGPVDSLFVHAFTINIFVFYSIVILLMKNSSPPRLSKNTFYVGNIATLIVIFIQNKKKCLCK